MAANAVRKFKTTKITYYIAFKPLVSQMCADSIEWNENIILHWPCTTNQPCQCAQGGICIKQRLSKPHTLPTMLTTDATDRSTPLPCAQDKCMHFQIMELITIMYVLTSGFSSAKSAILFPANPTWETSGHRSRTLSKFPVSSLSLRDSCKSIELIILYWYMSLAFIPHNQVINACNIPTEDEAEKVNH